MAPVFRLAFLWSASIAVASSVAVVVLLLPHKLLRGEAAHASIEMVGSFAALLGAALLVLLVRLGLLDRRCGFAAAGLVVGGMLDAFHALSQIGNTFIWLHALATVSAGLAFALVWLPLPRRMPGWPMAPIVAVAVVAVAVAAASLAWPQALPAMADADGFTPLANFLNGAGGVGFLLAAGYFSGARHILSRSDSLLLTIHCLLFAGAGLAFPFSVLWDPLWWYWHLLRLSAYVVVVLFFFDIYHRADRAVQESEGRFRDLIEGSIQGTLVVAGDQRPLFANQACADIFGYADAEAVIGLGTAAALFVPSERQGIGERHGLTLGADGALIYEAEGVRRDGDRIWVEGRTRAVNWNGIPAVQVALVDITQRKRAEGALVAAKARAEEANAAKTRFLAAASHDMRQPLQAITLFLGVMERRARDGDIQELVTRIRGAAQGLGDLLDSLLDLSRLEAGQVTVNAVDFPVAGVLATLAAEFHALAEAKGLGFRLVTSRLAVHSDEVLLCAIVRNLLGNALRYTEHGRILLGCRRRKGDVVIEVWDTGAGIPKERLAMIFEEFYQIGNLGRDRRQGFGLGLAIVERLCRLLGHRIEVRSEPGRGSRFAIVVPRAAAGARTPAGPGESTPPADLVGTTIAVIEDDGDVRESLRRMLEQWGCRVVADECGEGVLQALGEQRRVPDLVLADYRLKGGALGTDAIAAIRRGVNAEVPALVLTGESGLPDSIGAGIAVLRKPCGEDSIRRSVAHALKARA